MCIFKFTTSFKRIFSLCCSYHNYTFRHLPTKGHLQQLDYFVDMTITISWSFVKIPLQNAFISKRLRILDYFSIERREMKGNFSDVYIVLNYSFYNIVLQFFAHVSNTLQKKRKLFVQTSFPFGHLVPLVMGYLKEKRHHN